MARQRGQLQRDLRRQPEAFFCSKAHLAARRERADHDGVGFTLTLEAALEIGLALFAPVLMPDRSAESERSAL